MKEEQDYLKDIAEIRSMMERSSKFLSLSGWAGIMAGTYALAGAWYAHYKLGFTPDSITYSFSESRSLIGVAIAVLILSLVTAIFFSHRKSESKGESLWNATSRRLLLSMLIPLIAGGAFILLMIMNDLAGLILPSALIFYGLSLFNAGHYTIAEVRIIGYVQILLGILNLVFPATGLLFWAIGFGVMHLLYGIYMHFRYER